MKKKVLALNECEEVVTNQKVVNEENPDGTITQVGWVTFEYQPVPSDIKASGCASEYHTNVVNNGAPETKTYPWKHTSWLLPS